MKKFFSQISHLLFFIAGLLTAGLAFVGAPDWVAGIIGAIAGISSFALHKWLYENK